MIERCQHASCASISKSASKQLLVRGAFLISSSSSESAPDNHVMQRLLQRAGSQGRQDPRSLLIILRKPCWWSCQHRVTHCQCKGHVSLSDRQPLLFAGCHHPREIDANLPPPSSSPYSRCFESSNIGIGMSTLMFLARKETVSGYSYICKTSISTSA